MLYLLLIVIAVILYLIYKGQKPRELSREEINQITQEEIKRQEEYLLNKIKTSHLKDYLQTETALFDSGKKNFTRLSERFKHDETKSSQISKDWLEYMESTSDAIFNTEMLDVCTSDESSQYYDDRDALFVKIQEINKRFKELLDKEYLDPRVLLYPNLTIEEIEKL